jgi:hypothetical protein
MKENEMGGLCGTYGSGKNSVQGFGEKARRKKTTRKTDSQMEMGSESMLGRLIEGMEWILLAEDRARCGLLWTRWRTFGFWLNAISNSLVS